MIDERRAMQKLEEEAAKFQNHMQAKRYQQAKYSFDRARTVAVFNELEEEKQDYLFGKMAERGEIIQDGLFKMQQVSKVYAECCVKAKALPNDCLLCKESLRQKNKA